MSELVATTKSKHWNGDHWGAFASVLCAIHCALTPVLLIAMPHFGKIWSHPASHWGMALIVIPLVLSMTIKNFNKHGRKWVVATSVIGVTLIILGALAPYFESSIPGLSLALTEAFTVHLGYVPAEISACVDQCCPSMHVDDSNIKTLAIPLASIITTLGGIALIATHIGNLCACKCCNTKAST
ncbi:MerC domain-containing protein [Rubritalea marina]|uniref:MerC domain-containing protein n=1 Tax=Rubritalea marina TaxID=361055 RepID=UPI00146137AF|nr:MerC domain-containing protein [Rubritalea marina]